jgi:hypothetical protein
MLLKNVDREEGMEFEWSGWLGSGMATTSMSSFLPSMLIDSVGSWLLRLFTCGTISPVEGRLVHIDNKLRGINASENAGVFEVNGTLKVIDVGIK